MRYAHASRIARRLRRATARAGAVAGVLALAGCAPERDAPDERRAAGSATGSQSPTEPHDHDGQGTVFLDPADAVVCGSLGSWTVGWVAGPAGLDEGDAAVLQVSPFWGWTPPQAEAPGRPGYTTAAGPAGVTFRTATGEVPMTLLAHVTGGRLSEGDTLRFVYGDTAGVGPGSLCRTDMYAERFERFLIKTDGNGDGFFVEVSGAPTLRILPGPPARLTLAAPASARPGDSLTIGVHALDARGNVATLPAGEVSVEAVPLRTGTSASDRVSVSLGRAIIDREGRAHLETTAPASGLYRLRAATEGGLRGVNDLLLVDDTGTFDGIYWGDIHTHSALSDGTGHPADLYAFARDVAGLDVCAITDHDAHGLRPLAGEPWETVREATRAFHAPGRFVTLLAYEWTSWTWGHRNVYYPEGEGEVFSNIDEASDTPGELWERIAPYGGVTIPHHPLGGPIAMDWTVPSPQERETVVEICSIHGSSEALGVERAIYRPVPGRSVRDALNAGFRLGIVASGDTHDGHPGRRPSSAPVNGLAAFRCAELTREAVMDAIAARSVYGTSGSRILLATDWAGHAPGSELDAAPHGTVTVHVAAPEPIESVALVGPDGEVGRLYGGGRFAVHRLPTSDLPPDASWAYVRVALADGEVAWDSPWWIGDRR